MIPLHGGQNSAAKETEPVASASPSAAEQSSNAFDATPLAIVELDITHLLHKMLNSPRSFAALLPSDNKQPPLVLPYGVPSHDSHREIGKKLRLALKKFELDYQDNQLDVRQNGANFPEYLSGDQGDDVWFALGDLFELGHQSLIYLESKEVSQDVVEKLQSKDESGRFLPYGELVNKTPPLDPLRVVADVTPGVRRVRLRAATLAEAKRLAEDIEKIAGSSIAWSDPIDMQKFAINVQPINVPGSRQIAGQSSSANPAPFLYLVRTVAKNEISGAVDADLKLLCWVTSVGSLAALIAALSLAYYFTQPIRGVASAADEIGELDLTREDDAERVRQLLRTLPTNRGDETGQLAVRFSRMIEQILQANAALRVKQTELQQAKDTLDLQVQLKTRELKDETERAQDANQAKSVFLATVSHDMRQPLHIFFTHAQLLRESELTEEQQQSVELIYKNARRLKFLINDILDYQRIIGGEIDLMPEEVDVQPMLQDIANDFQEGAAERNNDLIVRCEAPGEMVVDRSRLERVLVNLLSNACKFTRGGKIEISTHTAGDGLIEFRVRDEGQGMTAAQQAKIFQPLMSSRHRGNDGTGLGLFICKALTEKMGGSICFESIEGRGTTFHIVLPRTYTASSDQPSDANREPALPIILPAKFSPQRPVPASAQQLASVLPVAKVSSRRGRPTALVIDDEDQARKVLANMLHELGYETLLASGGRQGIAMASEHCPDLITLDVIMPDMSGWDVLSQIKLNPLTEDIPVIVVTVLAAEESGNVLGADGFLTKPFKFSSLSSTVQKSLRGTGSGEVLVVDDDADCRRDLRKLLQSCGWSVVEACDGEDALEQIAHRRPDLAIIDLNMPKMDGFTLIDILRQKEDTEQLPIVVLSAVELSAAERQRLESTTSRFFGKGGVNLNMLNIEISRLVRRQHHAEQRPTSTTSERS